MKAYTSRVSKRTRAKKTASSARAWRRPTSALDDDVLSREKPSDGKVALARALAVASADDAALGQTRGIRELAPFFVLLRRLAAVPEYAAAMAPAALAGARGSRRRRRRSRWRREGPRRRDPPPPTRRRFFAWASVPRPRRDARLCASEHDSRRHERRERPDPRSLLDSLRVAAEAWRTAPRARDAARGVSASGMGEKGARRRKTNHGGDALQDALQDARDALDPLDTSLPKRQRNVDETKKTASRGVGDVRVRFGDPRFATSAEAFGDEPAAHGTPPTPPTRSARVSGSAPRSTRSHRSRPRGHARFTKRTSRWFETKAFANLGKISRIENARAFFSRLVSSNSPPGSSRGSPRCRRFRLSDQIPRARLPL